MIVAMKKLISFLLALVMTLSLALGAFAESTEEPKDLQERIFRAPVNP